ncbi:hypothetical protein D3C72_1298460 [compost metagenome]
MQQRADAVGADVVVDAIEFRRARHPEPVFAEAAADQLGRVVEQADGRRGRAAGGVIQLHGDGIAFHGIHVHMVAQHGRHGTAGRARTDDDGIEQGAVLAHADAHLAVLARQRRDFHTITARHAQAHAGIGQAAGEFVDVARGIAVRVVAAVEVALQGRFDGAHFLRRDGAPLQAAPRQQARHAGRPLEAGLVTVDVQDAGAAVIEINLLCLRPRKQMFARGDRHAGRGDGVALVSRHGGEKLGKPAQLVPAGPGMKQQGRIAPRHPFQGIQYRCLVVPHFRVRGRQLPSVRIRGFHGRIAVAFDQGHVHAPLGQRIRRRHARDACAQHGHALHASGSIFCSTLCTIVSPACNTRPSGASTSILHTGACVSRCNKVECASPASNNCASLHWRKPTTTGNSASPFCVSTYS